MRYNSYIQPKNDDFGYETLPQFAFRPQPIDMTPTQATTKLCVDPNNLTNQLITILRDSFGIEPKGRGASTKNPTPITTTNSLTPEVIEFLNFLSLVGRIAKPH
jgi:hypothetical protein